MNTTRLIGLNDRIYRKFGEYCIAEADNACYILCATCTEEHTSEDSFWTHVRAVHNYTAAAPARVMWEEASTAAAAQQRAKTERAVNSPLYVEAEYLENMDLNDPDALLELDELAAQFFRKPDAYDAKKEEKQTEATTTNPNVAPTKTAAPLTAPAVANFEAIVDEVFSATPSEKKDTITASFYTPPPSQTNYPHKYIDIDRLASRNLLHGKVLKRLFQQMQYANNEFKYKLNQLAQQVREIEEELRKGFGFGRKRLVPRIMPTEPFTTRDEILLLDEELHGSKELREHLHDEALKVQTENADTYCRTLWRLIMSDEVSNQFCWRGVVGASNNVIKYPVKDMTIMDVFQSAFREKYPEHAINYFKDRTMAHFNKALERIKTYRKKRKRLGQKMAEDEEDETLVELEEEISLVENRSLLKKKCNRKSVSEEASAAVNGCNDLNEQLETVMDDFCGELS